MAIIRSKAFGARDNLCGTDVALIDSADKLLAYAAAHAVTTVPLDINAIAALLGLQIMPVSMEGSLSGRLYESESLGHWVVEVEKSHHPNRQRYTIAHELGHFCLHKHLQHIFEDQIFFRGGESCKEEWQANEFASSILMPADDLRRIVRSGVADVEELSERYGVSTIALRMRAKNLGFSGHGL